MSILQTVDLKKYYQQGETVTKALDGVSLEINAGEFVSVVGTSGSGKSTLLHMMGGLDSPTSGKVKMCIRDRSSIAPYLSRRYDKTASIYSALMYNRKAGMPPATFT